MDHISELITARDIRQAEELRALFLCIFWSGSYILGYVLGSVQENFLQNFWN